MSGARAARSGRTRRVVHLTLGLDVGGQEKLLVEFARCADRSRFDLHFLSLTGRGVLAPAIEAHGWPVTALNLPAGLRPDLVPRLARELRRLRPDLVHSHDDRPLIYGAPAARLAGVGLVVHTRHHQGTRLSARQRLLVRLATLCNHRFVCISHDSAAVARRQGIPPRQLRVIHNGIDLTRFAFTGPAPTGPAVLVARLAPEKGIDTLLDAAARIVAVQPDFRLWIAGDGPSRGELERQARTLGLDGVVRFLGTVHDVPGLLAGARLFVLPSLTEGVSLTLLEAMARGLPVVATAVGGTPEVVADAQTGCLVPPRDPQTLARAVQDLWTRPDSCARISVSGRNRVEIAFDVRRMVARYEDLYEGQ